MTNNESNTPPSSAALAAFHAPVQEWFRRSFGAPTPAQEAAWPAIMEGETTLILAPTGSGKTLAAFLAAIDRLMFSPIARKEARCRVLYVSPLKALAVDVERNLRAPLAGVASGAAHAGVRFHLPEVAIRTGDTPGRDRARFVRRPSDILITTPESLYLLLTSAARESLRSVETVIIDEIHTMVATKRGAHLMLSLERLEELLYEPLQRVGLSATVHPVDEAARFLGGFDEGTPRPVTIADARAPKRLDLLVEVPIEEWATNGETATMADPTDPSDPSDPRARSQEPRAQSPQGAWPAIYPRILDLVRAHRSTLIFANSRRLAERMAAALNDLAGEEIVRAHHGSLAREQRLVIEEELKAGRLPALVATSSLELGIDMGAIDLVIQVETPPSVASGLQRIGRAGHHVDAPSKGVILPKYRGDLLACAALTERMQQGHVEAIHYLRSPLDVLAQQIVGMVAVDDWSVDELERTIRRAAPFAELPRSSLEGVLDMLSGRYPSADFAELRPRITWDRVEGTLAPRDGARRVAIANSGAIPDRGLFGVFLLTEEKARPIRVGELDEEMVFESKVGDVFVLGASSWRIEEIDYDRVLVIPAPGQPGRMPFWHGDSASRPIEFGRAIGSLARTLRELPRADAATLLVERHRLTEAAAESLLTYLEEQRDAVGIVPDDETILVESNIDEMGDWRVCILTPFGARVHAPWAMAIAALHRARTQQEADILWTDDGIVVRLPDADTAPEIDALLPDPDAAEALVTQQLRVGGGGARQAGLGSPASALFASRFREASARALLLPRRRPGQRLPLWQQRKRAADLLHATARFGTFPMVLETFRECMRDVFDMPALTTLLHDIRQKRVQVVPVTTRIPSPFASSLLFFYVANFMYEGDSPLAERRAQALAIDPVRLRELLGEAALRELLDADALAEMERHLQHLSPERRARTPDALHDLLLRLGALTRAEIGERCDACVESVDGWLAELEDARRVVAVAFPLGVPRYLAVEEVARYRDAIGIVVPDGLPAALLEPVEDPFGDLLARYARTHGPFTAQDAADALGSGVAPVRAGLTALEQEGRVVQGEFRPGGHGVEWCDAGVLTALRQKSLARHRRDVEPVSPEALGRFFLEWQGVSRRRRGPDALRETIEQLQGYALPASDWESTVLPSRVAGYDPRALDDLLTAGEVVWVGSGALGERDGRVAFFLVAQAALFLEPASLTGEEPLRVHDLIRAHLAGGGASFFPQIAQACEGSVPTIILDALWDLVWSGEVTNDTLQPLRAYARRGGETARRRDGETARRRFRSQFVQPPDSAGRWSLVRSRILGTPSATDRLTARAEQLLHRYGVLTREAVAAEGRTTQEGTRGGFGAVYPVLRAMEEAGQIRRGYFVAGLGATQFARPEAVDRLRALRENGRRGDTETPRHGDRGGASLLAATDPANPYGAALPWPEREDGRRPSRAAGAIVILVEGTLAAWMGRGERGLLTFPDAAPHLDEIVVAGLVARALADEVDSGRRDAVFIREVNGEPATRTPIGRALVAAGFVYGPQGYMKRG